MTSAEKKIIAAITAAIERVGDGSDEGGNVLGDATNGGIGLAPYHNFEDLITDEIQAAIDEALAESGRRLGRSLRRSRRVLLRPGLGHDPHRVTDAG